MPKIPELIEIATGRSRKETSWKNTEITWTALVDKLSKTHRTSEKYDEYLSSPKSRQDEIKDIGGFVGGFISGGRRKKGSILSRSLLTLDIDHCPKHFDPWEVFTLTNECAACIYSTHKHRPSAKRLRLVIPLSRDVNSEEYVAIARRIAGDIDIEVFDDTTFQPHRLMYWPSTAKDAEFYFKSQDGDALDVDEVLSGYHDWKDISEHPYSSRVNKIVEREIKKQGDPLEKPGLIGAFCQIFPISHLIEKQLPDVYEACDADDRYTFIKGSTAAGVVVYEDKWIYSHHETDPTSGKLCNAFDLYRIHKHGLKDEDVRPGTPGHLLPSYKAAVNDISKIPEVKKLLGEMRLAEARDDFKENAGEPEGDEPVNMDWLEQLEVDGKGNYLATVDNAFLMIENDPNLKGRFARDIFERVDRVVKNTPWDGNVPEHGRILNDDDDAGLRRYIEKVYKISSAPKIGDALRLILKANEFHPVRDYLKPLKWDGVERLDTLLIDFLNAEDCDYVRAITRKTMVAAVARVMRPGIKFDYVLTMIGKEGIKKSSILQKLGGAWFSDSFSTVTGKESGEQVQGVWLMEIGELAGLKKAEVEAIKLFISKRQDRYRPAYGKRVEEYPRQCVFIATTNEYDFLKSQTGNRRFWPVEVSASENCVFEDLTDEDVEQIWAEAKHYYQQGEALWLEDLEGEARVRQEVHTESDDRKGAIQEFLEKPLPDNWESLSLYDRRNYLNDDDNITRKGTKVRTSVSVAEIWCELFGKPMGEMTRYNTRELNQIMRTIEGWENGTKSKRDKIYGKQRVFVRTV